MTLASSSIKLAPDVTGTDAAFHTVSAKGHQVVMSADDRGHILGTAPTYKLFVPASAVAANKVWLDLFNATGSGKTLKLRSLSAIKDGSVAVVGVLSVKLYITRTTAVGTGGTAAVSEGTSLTVPALCQRDPADAALPALITARAAPTGGATAGAVLSERHVMPEETSPANYEPTEFVASEDVQPIVIPENTGVRVVQGAVASVGNIGFEAVFEAV